MFLSPFTEQRDTIFPKTTSSNAVEEEIYGAEIKLKTSSGFLKLKRQFGSKILYYWKLMNAWSNMSSSCFDSKEFLWTQVVINHIQINCIEKLALKKFMDGNLD